MSLSEDISIQEVGSCVTSCWQLRQALVVLGTLYLDFY